jgi:predicted dehydrogenase
MHRLALVGDEIIHKFLYPGYLNGFDPEAMERHAGWMAPLFRGEPTAPLDPDIRVVAIASPDTKTAEHIAEACRIDQVVASVEDLPADLDGALIMERQGAKHLGLARRFLASGGFVFIDKPVVESLADWHEMKTLAERSGARLTGGSSLRYSGKLAEIKESIQSGQAQHLVLTGPGPWYEYGCHLVELAESIWGPDVRRTEGTGGIASGAALLEWDHGRFVTLQWGRVPGTFRIDAYGEAGCTTGFVDDPKVYYRGMALSLIPHIKGEAVRILRDMETVVSILDSVGGELTPAAG